MVAISIPVNGPITVRGSIRDAKVAIANGLESHIQRIGDIHARLARGESTVTVSDLAGALEGASNIVRAIELKPLLVGEPTHA